MNWSVFAEVVPATALNWGAKGESSLPPSKELRLLAQIIHNASVDRGRAGFEPSSQVTAFPV